MANIKKSFNFRNGVQVDDDNLKVSATGLVGIGTTVPTEALDVRGNLVVSGVSSAPTIQAGVATITTLNPTEIIGAGVSIKSGIITASSGIITFFGDGINLLNLPTSQWEDTIVGAGVSSIYNTGGNVGIATTAAIFTLQVGNDVNSGQKGVGISSFGDVKASGIVTATGLVGDLTGDVVGNVTGNVTGNLTGNVNSSGLSTFSDLLVNRNLEVSGISTLGITTVTNLTAEQVNVSGISTMSGGITIENLTIGHLEGSTVGIAASINTNNPGTHLHLNAGGSDPNPTTFIKLLQNTRAEKDLTVTGSISAQQVSGEVLGSFDQLSARQATFGGSGGFLSAQNGLSAKNLRLATTGTDSTITSVGTPLVIGPSPGGANTNLKGPVLIDGVNAQLTVAGSLFFFDSGQTVALGIGTLSAANDIQVRNSGNAEIQVTSDTGVAGLTVGREASTGNTNNAEFRYGGGSGYTYSSAQSLDILNYGTGNFNYHLSANDPGGVQGDFHWHKGSNNVRLMTLTNTGRLGIGVTQPTDELDIVGGATVSGNVVVGNNLTVTGNIVGNVQGTLTGNVAGTLAGNTNTTVGISTLNNLSIAGIATAVRLRANNFAIGQDPNTELLSIFVTNANKIIVNDVGQIGISTTTVLPGVTISASTANMSISQIGVGVTQFSSGSVDFSTAGGPTLAARRYMVPPKATTTERNNFTGLVSGAMIYNTSLNKLQVYNGSAWETITSS